MATWNQLKQFIRENLKVLEDGGDVIEMGFEFDGGNDVVVLVERVGNSQIGEWAQVEAAFAKIDEVDLDAAVRKSENILCGGIACNGEYATLRHSVPLEDVDGNEILIPINAIASSANDFISEFGGEGESDEGEEEGEEEA